VAIVETPRPPAGGHVAEQRLPDPDERGQLVALILEQAGRLSGDGQTAALRHAFVRERYGRELRAWRAERTKHFGWFLFIALATAALGVASSGLAAATSSGHLDAPTIALIVIGVLVASLTALNQALSPRELYIDYKRDEAELRRIGWRYLEELEEGADPRSAYSTFQSAASRLLDREHLSDKAA